METKTRLFANLIVYPVKDIAKAKPLYEKLLGVAPYVDSPYYVGFRVDGMEFGLANGEQTGAVPYWQTTDITASLKTLTDAGATVVSEPREVGGGLIVASVKDDDGNTIGLRQ